MQGTTSVKNTRTVLNTFREIQIILARSKSRSIMMMAGVFCFSFVLTQVLLVAGNSDTVLSAWFQQLPVEVYLTPTDSSNQAQMIKFISELGELQNVQIHRILTPEQAAAEFKAAFNLPDIESLLGENPFPTTVELTMPIGGNIEGMRANLESLKAMPQVSEVVADLQMMGEVGGRLRHAGYYLLAAAITSLLVMMMLVLGLVSSFVRNWKKEIDLQCLLGATSMRIARPLLLGFALLAALPLLASYILCLTEVEILNRFQLGIKMESIYWYSFPLLILFIVMLSLPGVIRGIRRAY
jgi:cell division protein FtsX